jgi:hypothetical protein
MKAFTVSIGRRRRRHHLYESDSRGNTTRLVSYEYNAGNHNTCPGSFLTCHYLRCVVALCETGTGAWVWILGPSGSFSYDHEVASGTLRVLVIICADA